MNRSVFVLISLALANATPSCIHDDRLKQITPEEIEAHNALGNGVNATADIKGAYYINLPTSALRRGRIAALLKMTAPKEMKVERFSAVTKTVAKKADLKEFTDKGIHEYMQKTYQGDTMWATVGVYLSHARLMKKIMTENPDSNEMFLILEDDAILQPDWHARFLKQLPQVPKDWDMIRIGYGTDSNLRCEDKITEAVYENRAPTRNKGNDKAFYAGNTAYIVRPTSIPRILAQLKDMPVLDVDGAMISKENGMRVYGLSDPLVFHGNGMGLSDRMWAGLNPLPDIGSFIQTNTKATPADVSLAGIMDSDIQNTKAVPASIEDQAFNSFAQDV